MDSRLSSYVEGVSSGKIITCKEVKQAVDRFNNDLERDDLEFREDKINKVLNVVENLQHFTGSHNNKKFILEPWQLFIIANIFGFYLKGTDTRRFTSIYIEVARKVGKTSLAAAICIYMLLEEPAAEVLLAANSKEQAAICFKAINGMVKKLDPQSKYFKPYRSDIKFPRTNSVIKVLAADAGKLDGYNASCYILDEYHAAPTSEVRDVLKSSQGMRDNPLEVIITTAGFNKSYPCYELRVVSKEILSGIKIDDSQFAMIFSLDDEKEIHDPECWIKANPNLGITVKEKYLKDQVNKANNNPSERVGVLTKNFNIWCDTTESWIEDDNILECTQNINLKDFKDESCYIGVDLSSVSDLTAVSYMINKNDKYFFKTHYYLPEESENAKRDTERYKNLQRQGYITLTSGNVVDYDYIINDISKINNILSIKKIGYDSWNSTQWAIKMTEIGFNLIPFSQTIGNFSKPTKELQRLLLSKSVIIDNNPLNREHFRNVVIKKDYNGNEKPDKSKNKNKIDGVIAIITALGVYLNDPDKNTNNYDIFTINF